ncbi:hypothetical protein [Neobacillus sp. 204]
MQSIVTVTSLDSYLAELEFHQKMLYFHSLQHEKEFYLQLVL